MSLLVRGEASESDEETIIDRPIVYAKSVLGEAAESDDEISEKNGNQPTSNTNRTINNNNAYLHKELVQSNMALWKNLTTFVRNVVLAASKQLLNADQMLIKSQVSMQSALSSLKVSHSNVKQLRDKTSDILTANFIPAIKI